MARIEKTVFISYRRTDVYTALAVYENLKNQGYDVFFDYRSISSGDFEQIIQSNIRARAHFLLILTPTALDRANEPGDWLRREIEFAIDERRNIIPLFFRGFRFGDPAITEKLTGKLSSISRYNGLNVHEDYFEEAMHRLRTQYLNIPLNTVVHPVSTEVRKVVREEQIAADQALQHIENVKELVKQNEKMPEPPRVKTTPKRKMPVAADISIPNEKVENKIDAGLPNVIAKTKYLLSQKTKEKPIRGFNTQIRMLVGGIIFVILLLWAGASLFENQPSTNPTRDSTLSSLTVATQTSERLVVGTPRPTMTPIPPSLTPESTLNSIAAATQTSEGSAIATAWPTTTSILPASTLHIGPTRIGNDGMTLLYVEAGAFTMGSDFDQPNQKPSHKVDLSPFWIDQTEVTNKMYSLCVSEGVCETPARSDSSTRSRYYGNSEFDNYPVIYINWEMAKSYCEWAGRHLPTEAEWEKSARGTDARQYPWGDDEPNPGLLNYQATSQDTMEVGNFPNGASPYGALDMAGNVMEWVADFYSVSYYAVSPSSNPPGPQSGNFRVIRGSAWSARDHYYEENYYLYTLIYPIKASVRISAEPIRAANNIGFRCAMDASP